MKFKDSEYTDEKNMAGAPHIEEMSADYKIKNQSPERNEELGPISRESIRILEEKVNQLSK